MDANVSQKSDFDLYTTGGGHSAQHQPADRYRSLIAELIESDRDVIQAAVERRYSPSEF